MKEYIITIIGATLLSAMAGIIAPEKWRSYVQVITGLVIISCIIFPVTALVKSDIFDGFDSVHQGFTVFNELLDTYHPAYFIHGHIHKNYQANFVREQQYNETTIINGYERYIIDV